MKYRVFINSKRDKFEGHISKIEDEVQRVANIKENFRKL